MTEPAPQYPLLFFAEPTNSARESAGGGQGQSFSKRPDSQAQNRRLQGKWTALQQALENRSASLTPDLQGVDPELVLVFEIIDNVEDFYRAVQQIEGFEYLAEFDEVDIDGEGVFVLEDEQDLFNGTLFLLASNQVALSEVLDLWNRYVADETAKFPYRLGRWKDVFRLLKDVRRWSPPDRLLGTGAIEDFRERQEAGQEVIPAEIELWFRSDTERRRDAEQAVRRLVADADGEVVTSAAISEIAYHALLVRLPIEAVEPLLSDDAEFIELIRAEEIAFVRPEAQAAVTMTPTEAAEEPFEVTSNAESAPPLVGILDGLPLARHELLTDRIELDDPEDWQSEIPAAQRQHGTAIASLVIHGDGNTDGTSLRRPIYVRPVLKPDDHNGRECIPHDQLAIDLVHRAIVNMVGEPGATSSSVRIVNLSIGDANAQLATSISPWARLLDWLSYRYKLLFVISAGNHPGTLTYDLTTDQFRNLSPRELRSATLRLLIAQAQRRRLLSPSEAMNCLCIGASHVDSCDGWVRDSRCDLLPGDQTQMAVYPSPLSAVGMGYKRSIKPDLLAPGGRILFRTMPQGGRPPRLDARPSNSILSPGLSVATPTARAGALDGTRYFHGTSGAAAIATHYCGVFLENLEELEDSQGQRVDPSYYAVLAKTILVHSTYLPPSVNELRAQFGDMSPEKLKDAVSRFYGYGALRPDRVLACTSTRATVLGWGDLDDGEADVYEFPLPPCISGKTDYRRVAITLSYFSPIRNRDRRHRIAQLFIKPKMGALQVSRSDADWRTVRRGTVQHEVLDGSRASAFVDGDSLTIQVNCRSLAGRLPGPVQYGLALTLEANSRSSLPIYEQVAERIAIQARTRVRNI